MVALFVLALAALAFCGYRWLIWPVLLDKPLTAVPPVEPLPDRLDPNTAELAELACLKGIGRSRAQAIIEFRKQYRQLHGRKSRAFKKAEDLLQIKGIGPATLAGICDLLYFGAQKSESRGKREKAVD
jgi:competence protein ComEA